MFKSQIINITSIAKKMFLIQKKSFKLDVLIKFVFIKKKKECNTSISSHGRSDQLVVNVSFYMLVSPLTMNDRIIGPLPDDPQTIVD